MSRTLVGIAACAVLVLATPAMAQRGQGRGGRGMFQVTKLHIAPGRTSPKGTRVGG